ncbi:MAG: Osmosensitive channel histidine kinase KdpD [Myxococcaceae bacterium]|nr:Osmosensitive channel histidine kinase KdpD [Myxococcaceae bacterium]
MGTASRAEGSGSKRGRVRAARGPAAPTKPTAKSVPKEDAAPASSRQKRGRDPLLSAICHDLRAPLAAVTMGANFVLQTTQRDDASARSVKILEAMLRSCSQMERLIRNFADLSEIEADSVSLRLGLHDAGEMLEIAAAAIAETAAARSVAIELRKPEEHVTMTCDRDRLLRSIGHVIENAVKLAPAGSTVSLSVALEGNDVCFAVTDRGPGLTPQVRRNLYDRHWHAKRASRVGAGFGLAITRGFLAAHGGRLAVDSRPDVETTFTHCAPKRGPHAE